MEKKRLIVANAVLWGTLWGIFECTVGALVHALPWSIGFLIWTPAALFFMTRAYRATGSGLCVFFVSCVTAALKLTNLFLPIRLDKVFNPAVSIVMEGLAFCAVAAFAKKKGWKERFGTGRALALSTLWRLGYCAYLLVAPVAWREVSVIRSWETFLQCAVVENLGAWCVMAAGIWAARWNEKRREGQGSAPASKRWQLNGYFLAALVCLGAVLQVTL